ncbi:hypothetical protein MMC17_004921 [Xylographa soralifera]|nr:hypothetical protein [Xylographa soralifera]
MTALAHNPLSIRNTQPDVFHARRKYSVRQQKDLNLALKSIETSLHVDDSTRPNNDASIDRDGTLNERRDIGFNAISKSVPVNQCRRNATNTTHTEPNYTYGPILQEKLVAARRAQAEWRENIIHDAERQGAAHRQLLQLAKEEQEIIANEEREALEKDHQRQIETHLARLATINLRRQLEAEELRREAERLEIEAQQRIKDEEESLALQQAILIEEELQRQEEAEEAERRRIARERECTVCLDTFDMETMVELRCEHWYCRDDLQGALQAAYSSRALFHCCRQEIPVELLTDVVSAEFLHRYRLLIEERSTPNPIFCSNRDCSQFLSPSQAQGPDIMQLKMNQGQEGIKMYKDPNERFFCSNCGSPLFIRNPNFVGAVIVTNGTQDEMEGWAPQEEFHCGQRMRWVPKLDGTVMHEEM